jgi:amino acid transporter
MQEADSNAPPGVARGGMLPTAHESGGEREEDPSLLRRAELHQGSRPGDVYVRVVRPTRPSFRRLSTGVLESTAAAEIPRTDLGRLARAARRALIGTPLVTAQAAGERLTKFKALAVLSSDAISSVAYATEAILVTLVAAGSAALGLTLLISLAIVALLTVVAISYRQTIPAYPNGGGSYIVATDNLGVLPGLVAAAALMIDYVLTVAVSVSAGVQALATLLPQVAPDVVAIDVACVLLITVVNLRGVRDAGSVFAIPTYLFIGSALLLILVGCLKAFLLHHQPLLGHFPPVAPVEGLGLFLILRSFAAGCSAMTGVEAISNGIPAFKRPEARNAAITLTWMAVLLGTLFLGISALALTYGVEARATGNPTVIGQIAQRVFTGPLAWLYPLFQLATLGILTLAANTSYADFPRLASLLARDHFLPHQFAFRGDRLAFSTGIVFLAGLASCLLVVFHGSTASLINLYAVGVFLSFTLSQAGMVRHWWRRRATEGGWRRSMMINGMGALTTLVVAAIIATTKFAEGAWVVVALLPLLLLLFVSIRGHYLYIARERAVALPLGREEIKHHLVVPVGELSEAERRGLEYARSFSPRVTAVHVALDPEATAALRTRWERWQADLEGGAQMRLDVIEPLRRSLVRSLLRHLHALSSGAPGETLTVLLPETARPGAPWRLLAHPRVLLLKIALFFQPEIVVTALAWEKQPDTPSAGPQRMQHHIVVPIAEIDWVSLHSLAYARSLSHRVTAVHIATDAHDVEVIRARWEQVQEQGRTHLVVVESPYRSLTHPLVAYIEAQQELYPEETLTVVLPEFVVNHWWEHLLHNQTALHVKLALQAVPHVVVTDIPQRLRGRGADEARCATLGHPARRTPHFIEEEHSL